MMDAVQPADRRISPGATLARLTISLMAILAGVAWRCDLSLKTGFWEDEIIAATHAVQPFPAILVNIVRNDIHPPLYFLQLHVWALLSHTDGWLIANSVLWGVAAIASLWITLRREGEVANAPVAAAFLAVLPAGLWMSEELRPYAWLSVLLIWGRHFAQRGFGDVPVRRAAMLALLALELGMTYSHAIGFLMPFFLGVYSAALLWQRRALARDYVPWLVCHAVAGVAAVPILASNLLHDANLAEPGALSVPFSDVLTAGARGAGVATLGLVAYCGVLVAGLVTARARLATLCFILLPLVTALLLGAAVKPIFKANFFSTLLAPFVALVLAEFVQARSARWRETLLCALLVCFGALAVVAWPARSVTGYQSAAALVRAQQRPGDVVYAPQMSMFWGMAWYLAGPDWGSPLAVANPPNPQWRAVYRRLGPGLVGLLHLEPTAQSVLAPGGLALLTGDDSLPQAAEARRVWLVTNKRSDLAAGFTGDRIGPLHRVWQTKIAALDVSLFQ